ncbi:MAG: hypothetical protein M1832_005175 [Thelocarpon impressellum]|nr:MAG: hypothetical protein M1832_005175 [Thelocarpon impressellum]
MPLCVRAVTAGGARLGRPQTTMACPRPLRRASTKSFDFDAAAGPGESLTFTRPSGQQIGYCIVGPARAQHHMFFLHGWPCSRLEALALQKLADQLGVRIISPDRPGIGLSTFHPWTLLEYPRQIQELAAHLGLPSYRVLGGSGGGPPALACAHVLPRSKLHCVGVLAGLAPLHELGGFGDTRRVTRLLLSAVHRYPGLSRALVDRMLVRKAQHPDGERFRQGVLAQVKWGTAEERDVLLRDPAEFELIVRIMREHFRQGADAFLHEAGLALRPWGFTLDQVPYEGVRMFYGADDTNTPASLAREMAKRLRGSKLKVYEGVSHLTLFDKHGEEILRDMMLD